MIFILLTWIISLLFANFVPEDSEFFFIAEVNLSENKMWNKKKYFLFIHFANKIKGKKRIRNEKWKNVWKNVIFFLSHLGAILFWWPIWVIGLHLNRISPSFNKKKKMCQIWKKCFYIKKMTNILQTWCDIIILLLIMSTNVYASLVTTN